MTYGYFDNVDMSGAYVRYGSNGTLRYNCPTVSQSAAISHLSIEFQPSFGPSNLIIDNPNAGSRKKEAAWEFIKWALSKETIARIVAEHGYPSVSRRSIISSEKFREALTLNGQDVASLYLQVLELGGKTGYMKYRTVPVFPQVGDKINKAIERVATKQQDAPAAMKQAQEEAIQDLQKSGIKIDL